VNQKILAWSFPVTVLVVLISWRFLDAWIALHAREMLKSNFLFQTSTLNIPDVLFMLVCIGSVLVWGRYLVLRRQGITNEQSRFCQIAGTAVPLAFFLKWLFKFIFGRTNTRVWIVNQVNDDFHWFNGGGDYSSFPSGHMMVFTAFFFALWPFYPRYRLISVVLMLILAAALVTTDYHYLSDVIAGAYLGMITTFLTKVCFEKTWR
jgi:membrane-associated phospholipid phosphatase